MKPEPPGLSSGVNAMSLQQNAAVSRFWAKVQKTDGCWLWSGAKNSAGYGVATDYRPGRRQSLAHRMSYELALGAIPAGLTIDHLCRNTICVRPSHLRACTMRENLLSPGSRTFQAKNAAKTHCVHGHQYTPENTYTRLGRTGLPCRDCRTCHKVRAIERNRRMKGAAA